MFASYVGVTYWVVAQSFDRPTAWIAATLVAAAATFMEMNFLLSEGPVLLCGLFGYHALLRRSVRPAWADVGAGFLIGAGLVFKSVAAFYVIGACAYLLAQGFAARTPIRGLARSVRVGLGAVVWVIGPAAYFAATGRLHAHLEWTYIFPALYYPGNTVFLGKLLIKTSFFLVLLAVAVACSVISGRIRNAVFHNEAATLALGSE